MEYIKFSDCNKSDRNNYIKIMLENDCKLLERGQVVRGINMWENQLVLCWDNRVFIGWYIYHSNCKLLHMTEICKQHYNKGYCTKIVNYIKVH